MPSSAPSCIPALPPSLPSQHGRFLCSAVGSSCDALLSIPQRAIVCISWKLDSTSSGPKTGLLSGPSRTATLPLSSATHANQLLNRSSHVSAKLPLLPNQEKEDAPWLQPRTLHQSQSLSKLCKRSKSLSSRLPCQTSSCPRLPSSSQTHSNVLGNLFSRAQTLRQMLRLSEPAPLGMRAEHWCDFGEEAGDSNLFVQVVAHIAPAATQYCSTSDLDKSHHSPDPQGDTDHFS